MKHDRLISLIGLALFVVSLAVATTLKLRSDFTELLPQDDPELVQLRDIAHRVGAPSTLIVAIEGKDPLANERLAEALVGNLRSLIGTDLRSIDYRPDASRAFFERHSALYSDLNDLRRGDDDLRKLIASRKNPAFVAFGNSDLGEAADDPLEDLKSLEHDLEARHTSQHTFPSGYYESEDRSLLAIVTWTISSGTGDASGFRIRDDVQRVIDQTVPSRFGHVEVKITGDVPSAIEEHDALKSDIEWISIVCTVLVLLAIFLFFRGVTALAHVFFPALLGVAVAFAATALTVGYLNTNTAFLGSIILGNGINFGIILLARYREERLARVGDVAGALERAIENTARPTLAAALAAGIAYGSLALTTFRGFRQFGEIGGVGMMVCWVLTYSYGPALIHFTERVVRPRTRGHASSRGALTRLAGFLFGHPRSVTIVVVCLTGLAVWRMAPLVSSPVEYDFSKLRNQRSKQQGAGDLYVRVGRIFPQDLAPVGVAIVPRAADALSYRTAVLTKDCVDALGRGAAARASDAPSIASECARRVAGGEPTGGLLSAVATIYDYLPRDQAAKLPILADISRRLKEPALSSLTREDRQSIDKWIPSDFKKELELRDLPEEILRRFRELDGQVGRVALIFPVRVWPNWDGHSLIRLSDVLKNVRLPNGEIVNAAGQPSLFAAMLRSMAHDGPVATQAALVGVVVMIILLFRKLRPVVLVLLSLLIGMVWMAGAGAAVGLRLNFLNFVTIPVTLGVGVDYAVNIFARLVRETSANRAQALAETGSAVALCSLTTIIGYSSLFVASNGALRSFGKLADLGEIGCLLSALLVVPWMSRSPARFPTDQKVPR